MEVFDFIVIGVGGMGSAALYHLARRGHRVLGLERFSLGHDRGSSHGETRIIRKAYFEHPAYVPLLQRAYALWDALAAERGEELLVRAGLLLAGREAGAVIAGARRAAAEHGVPVEDVAAAELPRRFPGFALGDDEDMVALFEPEGGLLQVEACVRAHGDLARAAGAELREGEVVRALRAASGPSAAVGPSVSLGPSIAVGGAGQAAGSCTGVVVETDRARYAAAAVVLCGGAYSAELLRELALPLRVRRKIMLWYDVPPPAYRLSSGCPVFAFDTGEGFFYGFPVPEEGDPFGAAPLLKVAEHHGGEEVQDPAALDRSLRPGDEAPVRRFLQRHLPAAALAPRKQHGACMYTMTPDEHFIIDRHPRLPGVVYAAGFSGHGFKFASVVGEALADLAAEGRTALPVDFLRAARLGGAS